MNLNYMSKSINISNLGNGIKHGDVYLIILNETDFNGEMVVQNYLERTGREEWARQVSILFL